MMAGESTRRVERLTEAILRCKGNYSSTPQGL